MTCSRRGMRQINQSEVGMVQTTIGFESRLLLLMNSSLSGRCYFQDSLTIPCFKLNVSIPVWRTLARIHTVRIRHFSPFCAWNQATGTRLLEPGTRLLEPGYWTGTRLLEPGYWSQATGTRLLEPGYWNQATGARLLEPGYWNQATGARLLDWNQTTGTRLLEPGYWNQATGTRLLEPGYWNQATGTRLLEPGYWNQATGTRLLEPGYWNQAKRWHDPKGWLPSNATHTPVHNGRIFSS